MLLRPGVVICFSVLLMSPSHSDDPASRLLSYKQYANIKHDVPYLLEFKVGQGALLIYGTRHVFDPKDPLIADIQKEWEQFHPDVAYNEGGNPPSAGDLKSAVERYAEAGLVRYLASRDAVPVATFEPPNLDEVEALKKQFTGEQVKVFYALRSYLTYRHSRHEETAEQFMNDQLSNTKWKMSGLDHMVRDVNELEAACLRLFKGLHKWQQIPEDWFDPTQDGQFTNSIQNLSGMFRDRHIFHVLSRRAQRGDRVFAVIGVSHVPVQEPALVALLGQPIRKRDGEKTIRPGK